ncbi:MAG: TetR/AcrR family transcriptional regulator [Flavobacterium sp.]
MKDAIKQPWIQVGYELFAHEGPKGLKIELLARKVAKNKSSFYHLFADIEIFTAELLAYHIAQSKAIAQQARECAQIDPDLIHLLLNLKIDILFNRHLRIHRDNPVFKKCFEEANKPVEEAFLTIWTDALGLNSRKNLAKIILDLTTENFYLQVTAKNLTYDWLVGYFEDIKKIVLVMETSDIK